jgi:tRNA (cmo5U34)-methyltransferase
MQYEATTSANQRICAPLCPILQVSYVRRINAWRMPDAWQESDSKMFLDLGRVFTPNRDEIETAILQLIPARTDERFSCVDIGAGEGWLSHRVLQRFSAAQVIALDGSSAMLARARDRLAPFGERADVRQFRLEEESWISSLPGGVRCFLSSMVLHHLDDASRWRLFRNLYRRLEPGGAMLLADVILASSEAEREYCALFWDAEVKRQSLEMTKSLLAFDQFDGDQWNVYRYPDPVDKPSRLLDQLKWLEEVGFEGVSVYWLRAGHAVFGGFKAKA